MSAGKVFRVCGGVMIIALALASPIWAVMGDCNNDGVCTQSDAATVIDYLLFGEAPPVNMFDCDCDGFPGITMGDAFQILGYMFAGEMLYPSLGTDLPIPSHTKFYYNAQFPLDKPKFKIAIYVDVPPGDNNDIASWILPFSFAAISGQISAICDSISFEGTVSGPQSTINIDAANERFVIQGASISSGMNPCLPGGTQGLLCTAYFTAGAGTIPNTLEIASTDRVWPMLLHENFYHGVNGQRVFLPEFIRANYGDANCDGMVNVSDAVYIINFVFTPGSPRPGDCEP